MEQKVGKRLREYTSTAINTGGEVYQSLMANEADDREEQGAIEGAINDLFTFLNYYREKDIFRHEGMHLLKGLNFFSGLRKNPNESLKLSFEHKYKSMLLRHDPLDTVWGTKWNVEHALRYYFHHDNVFVMEFTNKEDTNLLSNEFTNETWTIDGVPVSESDNLTEESALVNIKGVLLSDNVQLKTKEKITIKEGVYSLHFFMRGQKQKDKKRIGSLKLTIGDIFKKIYTCNDVWENKQETIYLPQGDYEFCFTGIHSCDVDFICLFPEVPYPSVSILIGNGGLLGKALMFFAPGKQDVQKDAAGNIIEYFEPPYKDTHDRYKYWYPFSDDTEKEAKQGRKEKNLDFNDPKWGYWADDMRWIDIEYIDMLLLALMPVGVKIFGVISSRRGA